MEGKEGDGCDMDWAEEEKEEEECMSVRAVKLSLAVESNSLAVQLNRSCLPPYDTGEKGRRGGREGGWRR